MGTRKSYQIGKNPESFYSRWEKQETQKKVDCQQNLSLVSKVTKKYIYQIQKQKKTQIEILIREIK